MKANHVLKFRKVDKFLIDSLIHSHLYFAPPDKLNDPFDCKIDVKKSWENAISQSSGSGKKTLESIYRNPQFHELINEAENKIKNYGIFSGSHRPVLSFSLMWSHYADSHRGVCLIYAIPTDPDKFFRPNQIKGIQNVEYGNNKLTEWIKELPNNPSIHDPFSELYKVKLTIKDTCWKYEDEVRMIRKSFGAVAIDKSYLQNICFGLDTAKDDIKLIREIITKFNYNVGFSKIERTDDDFGIKAIAIV
jgi:hypothetical protein